jgi:hypothetical protein
MRGIDAKRIWDYAGTKGSSEVQIQVVPERSKHETTRSSRGAQIPISYKQLQDYGYCIISQQKFTNEGHSKYEVSPLSRQITFIEKDLQHKRKLTGLPSFLKVYLTRMGGKEANCTVVSERFESRQVEWTGHLVLNI